MGRTSNIKYKPYVFTEQGVYMLMTVLRGDLAIKQSHAFSQFPSKDTFPLLHSTNSEEYA